MPGAGEGSRESSHQRPGRKGQGPCAGRGGAARDDPAAPSGVNLVAGKAAPSRAECASPKW